MAKFSSGVHASVFLPLFGYLFLTVRGQDSRDARELKQTTSKFQCDSEGFFADAADCSIFYRCLDWGEPADNSLQTRFTSFKFQCGNGFVFDSQRNSCIQPSHSSRSECRYGTSEPLLFNFPRAESMMLSSGDGSDRAEYGVEQPQGINSPSYSPSYNKPNIDSSLEPMSDVDNGLGEQPPRVTRSPPCNAEGFFPIENDCARFYRCVASGKGFSKYEFSCGEGTVWDPDNNACNHAWAVQRNDCKNIGPEDGNQSGAPDPNQNGGDQNPNEGPASGNENPYPNENENPYPNGNENPYPNGNENPYPNGSNNPEPEQNGYPNTASTENPQPNPPDYGSNPPSEEGGNQTSNNSACPSEGFHPVQNDCKKFIRCVNNGRSYTKFEFECAEGTVWDADVETCNYPEAVRRSDCKADPGSQSGADADSGTTSNLPAITNDSQTSSTDNGQSSSGTTSHTASNNQSSSTASQTSSTSSQSSSSSQQTSSTSSQQTSSSSSSQQTSSTTSQSSSSSSSASSQGSTQTSSSTQQSSGQQTSSTAAGQQSSSTTSGQQSSSTASGQQTSSTASGQQSSSASTSGQQTSSTASGQQNSSTSSTSNQQISTTGSGTTNQTTTNQQSTTNGTASGADQCTGEGFFPSSKSCNKFYRCVPTGNGGYTKYDFDCGPGTVFDPDFNVCNHPWAVRNEKCRSEGQDNGGSQGSTTPLTNGETTPPVESTKPSSSTSKPGQTQPMSSTSTTTSKPNGTTPLQPSKPPTSTSPGGSNTTSTTKRPTVTPTTKKPGSSPNTTPSTNTTTTTTITTTTTSKPTTEPNSPSNGTTNTPCPTNATKPASDKVKCTKAGFYPYPGDCKKFYRCVDWDGDKGERFSVYYFDCPEGTIFDPSLSTCNHEESVYPPRDCSNMGNSTTEPTPSNETSTATDSPTTITTESTALNSTDSTSEPTSSPQTTTQVPTDTTTNPTAGTTPPTEEETTFPSSSSTGTSALSTTESTTSTTESTTSVSNPITTTTVTTSTDITTTMPSPTVNEKCPEMGPDQFAIVCPTGFRRHPKYCNLFYQCTTSPNHEIKVLTLACTNGTVYDDKKIQCLPPDQTKECEGKMMDTRSLRQMTESSIAPIPVKSDKTICPNEGSFAYKDDCRLFYKCKKDNEGQLNGFLYQCPEGFGYWTISKRCEKIQKLPQPCGNKKIAGNPSLAPVENKNVGHKK